MEYPDVNPERLRQAPNIAIVGSSSPLGKELRELIESSDFRSGNSRCSKPKSMQDCFRSSPAKSESRRSSRRKRFADTDIAFFACSPEIIEAYAASGSAFPGSDDRSDADRPKGYPVS